MFAKLNNLIVYVCGYSTMFVVPQTFALRAKWKIEIKDYQKGVMTVNLLQKLQGAILQNENTPFRIESLSHRLAYDDIQTIYKSK